MYRLKNSSLLVSRFLASAVVSAGGVGVTSLKIACLLRSLRIASFLSNAANQISLAAARVTGLPARSLPASGVLILAKAKRMSLVSWVLRISNSVPVGISASKLQIGRAHV